MYLSDDEKVIAKSVRRRVKIPKSWYTKKRTRGRRKMFERILCASSLSKSERSLVRNLYS